MKTGSVITSYSIHYTKLYDAATLFLGGWAGPFFGPINLLIKVFAFMFFFIWIRATWPRVRYDQLMYLGWKVFLPLALANIVVTGIVVLGMQ